MRKSSFLVVILLFITSCSGGVREHIHVTLLQIQDNLVDKKKHRVDCQKMKDAPLEITHKNIKYSFTCSQTSLGKHIDLNVFKENILKQKLDSLATHVKNERLSYAVESWLIDFNGDGFLDLIKREKSFQNFDKDKMKFSAWDFTKNIFVKVRPDKETELKFRKNFKVKIGSYGF